MVLLEHSPVNLRPIHPIGIDDSGITPSIAKPIKIRVRDPLDHHAPAILHQPPGFKSANSDGAAVVLISGAGGGVSGPAGIYPSLGDKIASLLSIPCVRLEYREPARSTTCTADVIASFNHLSEKFSRRKFILVGWSFGGSPCFKVAAKEPERLAGVVAIASQTMGTAGIKQLWPRPLLLIHGTGDNALSPDCSKNLYYDYGPGGHRELKLFEGEDHGLSRSAMEVEGTVLAFVTRCFGMEETLAKSGRAREDLAGSREERVREMAEGGDLERETL